MPFWKYFPCMRFQNDESITKLDYSHCTLTDVPPEISQYERTLEELHLCSNRIKTLSPQLFYCQGLRFLLVNDNELESIPNAIGSLRHLQYLNISRNALSCLPDNIKACKNLTRLDLSLNNLQRLPDAITCLIALQELLLNETYLEFLPANFGRLVSLKILELRSNNLITLPKSMARLCNLMRIDIGANEFTELPEVVGQLSHLEELWIDFNRIRRISPNISNLRELRHFEANNNLLVALPNEISNWRNLEVLSVSTNDLESLPFSIGMLKSLVTLKCEANQLRELPDSISNLENLEELAVSHNFILRLPSTIGMLRKLRFLCADENLLRTVPQEICSCSGLTVFSVRNNKITELPQNIGHLVNLKVLNLVDNFISSLPVSILSLTKLTALWISDNQSQPLVPLQYFNTATNTELTCFMLPQMEMVSQHCQKQQEEVVNGELSPELSDNSLTNSYLSHPQQFRYASQYNAQYSRLQRKSEHSEQSKVSSPSRRICFADETAAKGTEQLAPRLMRSPTPYPKELRLMAKCMRHNQHHDQQVQKNNTQQYQKETCSETDIVTNTLSELKSKSEKSLLLPEVSVIGGLDLENGETRIKEARVLINPGPNIDPTSLSPLPLQPQTHSNFDKMHNENKVNVIQQLEYSYRSTPPLVAPQPQHYVKSTEDGTYNINVSSNVIKEPIENAIQFEYHVTPLPKLTCENYSQPQSDYDSFRDIDCRLTPNFLDSQYNQYHQVQSHENQQQNSRYFESAQPSQFSEPIYDSSSSSTSAASSGINRPIQNYPNNVLGAESICLQPYTQTQQHYVYKTIGAGTSTSAGSSKPPPYHIARAFTKKSREDLLNYDTIRSQIHQSIKNCDDDVRDNEAENETLGKQIEESCREQNEEHRAEHKEENENYSDNDNIAVYNNSNISKILRQPNNNGIFPPTLPYGITKISDYQNNNNHNLEFLMTPTYLTADQHLPQCDKVDGQYNQLNVHLVGTQKHVTGEVTISPSLRKDSKEFDGCEFRSMSIGSQSEEQGVSCSPIQSSGYNHNLNETSFIHNKNDNNEANIYSAAETTGTCADISASSSKMHWLFGMHKNPTVKQVAIKCEDHLGFEIQQKTNQEGIFVFTTVPNTSASTFLHANDKLLEVDGFDFTKIKINDARQILLNSGPVINIMLSRK